MFVVRKGLEQIQHAQAFRRDLISYKLSEWRAGSPPSNTKKSPASSPAFASQIPPPLPSLPHHPPKCDTELELTMSAMAAWKATNHTQNPRIRSNLHRRNRLYKIEVHPLKGQKTYRKPKNFHFIKGHHPRASNLFILAQIVCSIGCACYFVEMDPESMSIHFYDSSSRSLFCKNPVLMGGMGLRHLHGPLSGCAFYFIKNPVFYFVVKISP